MRIFTNDVTLIALGAVYLRIVSWSYLMAGNLPDLSLYHEK